MSVEQAIENVVKGMKLVLVPCEDERNRNVLRTTAFRLRNKMQESTMFRTEARNIGITNVEVDGLPFLKIYSKEESPLYTLDEEGELVLLESRKGDSPEELEILKRMVKDKKEISYIFDIMTEQYNWSVEEIAEKLNTIKPEEDTSQPGIPQDMLKREKLTKEDLV